jgi:clan AA aspartic protease (TIGR02281 family)
MICPKCGFRQPDDLYCARCGVEIERYVRERRKRRYRRAAGLTIVILVILAVVSAARYLIRPTPSGDRVGAVREGVAERAGPEAKLGAAAEPGQRQPSTVTPSPPPVRQSSQPSGETQKSSARSDQARTAQQARATAPAQPDDTQKREPFPKADKGALSAAEWFEKGRSLNDESDLEVQCYQKALGLDPEFAPAHFRLGAIYYRRADYDLAEREFARFLRFASEADKAAYDIYLYYSPDYLKGRVEEEASATASAKEPGKELVKKGERAERETKEDAKELQTIVQFSTTNGHMVVPVLLNDIAEARVVFDTGAEMTVLSRRTAESLGLRLGSERPVRLQTVAAQIQAPVSLLNSIQCGGVRQTNLPVAVVDVQLGRQVDGILGMDFLGNYTIRIDNETSRIVLKPRGAPNP